MNENCFSVLPPQLKIFVVSEDTEPRLTKAQLLAKNETWANLTWHVDLADAFTEVFVFPTDIASEKVDAVNHFNFQLENLVPGTSYQIALYPKFGETYGDYQRIDFTTNISQPVIDILFTSYYLTIEGNLTGRCTLLNAVIEEIMSWRFKTCDQPGDILTGNNPMVYFSFEIGSLEPGKNYTCTVTITAGDIQTSTSVDAATKPEVVRLNSQTVLSNFTTVMNFYVFGLGSEIHYRVLESSNQEVMVDEMSFVNSFTLTFEQPFLGFRLYIWSVSVHSGDESEHNIGLGVVTSIEYSSSNYDTMIIQPG